MQENQEPADFCKSGEERILRRRMSTAESNVTERSSKIRTENWPMDLVT